MWIGILGGILIIIAWLLETVEAIKRHKSLIDLKFALINIIAIALLLFYSLQRNDAVFIYLNIALFIIVLVEIAYSISIKKIHKR